MLRTCAVLVGVLFFTSSFTIFSNDAYSEETALPEWVKNIFVWYGQDQISEGELLDALQYLINNKILIVNENTNNIVDNSMPNYQNTIEDNGDFYVTFHPNPNSIYDYSSKDWIQDLEYFEVQVEYLNSLFKLPYDVEIVAMECNEANAYFDPETNQIIMCYEFMDSVYSDFSSYWVEMGYDATDEELSNASQDVIDFTFYHELGHALAAIYELPTTGLEENAVDQFAVLFLSLTENSPGYEGVLAQDILYNVGTWYLIQTELGYEQVYWDVHNLDIQRFYNISCYAYGQNVEYNQDLITEGWLPEERASNCEYEYDVLVFSWTTLLSPFYI